MRGLCPSTLESEIALPVRSYFGLMKIKLGRRWGGGGLNARELNAGNALECTFVMRTRLVEVGGASTLGMDICNWA